MPVPVAARMCATRLMVLRARRELKADRVVVNTKGGGGAVAMAPLHHSSSRRLQQFGIHIGQAVTDTKGKTRFKLDDTRPNARGTDDPQILMV